MITTVKPAGKLRLAFLGDSITVGDGDAQARGWPSRVCEATSPLPTKMHCYNLGVGGDCIADLALRAKDELNARLTGRTGCGVVVMIGVNDAMRAAANTNRIPIDPDAMKANLIVVLREAQHYGAVLVVEPAPVLPELRNADGVTGVVVLQNLQQINHLLSLVCRSEAIELVSLTEKLQADSEFTAALQSGDGLHPVDAGYDRIAKHLSMTSAWSDFLHSAGSK